MWLWRNCFEVVTKNKFYLLNFTFLYVRWWVFWLTGWWESFHNIYQTITVHTLMLYSFVSYISIKLKKNYFYPLVVSVDFESFNLWIKKNIEYLNTMLVFKAFLIKNFFGGCGGSWGIEKLAFLRFRLFYKWLLKEQTQSSLLYGITIPVIIQILLYINNIVPSSLWRKTIPNIYRILWWYGSYHRGLQNYGIDIALSLAH